MTMTKITVFSAPKPFSDPHIRTIQRNAVLSWKALGPEVDVLLIGDEPGIKETSAELGITHIPDVDCNQQGTPLVSSIFRLAGERSSSDIMIYINADIILLPEVLDVIDAIYEEHQEFLLSGCRWDLDITKELVVDGDWTYELKDKVLKEGRLRSYTAMDYFIFPRLLLQEIPPFAVGRAGWDNWMIYYGMQQSWPVIDITPSNVIIHQNHDYSHLPNGVIHYDLEESYNNVALAGGIRSMYDLLDVPLVFSGGRIRRKRMNVRRLLRLAERIITPNEQHGRRWQLATKLRKIGKRIDRVK